MHVVNNYGDVTKFVLVKCLYLIELNYLQLVGARLTDEPYIRIPMGPVPSSHRRLANNLVDHEIHFKEVPTKHERDAMIFSPAGNPRFRDCSFTATELRIINSELEWCAEMERDELRDYAYATPPMERFQEKEGFLKHRFGTRRFGLALLKSPYFLKRDIDPKAELRRICIERDKVSTPYCEKDAAIDNEIVRWLKPLADEAQDALGEDI